ncbi:MAG: pentapeptide repeat-containing protein [Candidatus Kapaibacterium sp.]
MKETDPKEFQFVAEKREKYILGILVIVGGILTLWRTIENSRQNSINKENNDNNLLQSQFSKATELLMSDNIAARLSGIYLFEKIMNSSEEYHWTVIELLTTFVREKRNRYKEEYRIKVDEPIDLTSTIEISDDVYDEEFNDYLPVKTKLRKISVEMDIQAILIIIGRRNILIENDEDYKKNYLNLSQTNLYGAYFSTHESDTSPNYMHFNFHKSILVSSHLSRVNFKYSDFSSANLSNASCSNTHFDHADLTKANLMKTKCNGASFQHADCSDAKFNKSNLFVSHFENSDCTNVDFFAAYCYETNFSSASNIKFEQLKKAETLCGVKGLYQGLRKKIADECPHLFEEPV